MALSVARPFGGRFLLIAFFVLVMPILVSAASPETSPAAISVSGVSFDKAGYQKGDTMNLSVSVVWDASVDKGDTDILHATITDSKDSPCASSILQKITPVTREFSLSAIAADSCDAPKVSFLVSDREQKHIISQATVVSGGPNQMSQAVASAKQQVQMPNHNSTSVFALFASPRVLALAIIGVLFLVALFFIVRARRKSNGSVIVKSLLFFMLLSFGLCFGAGGAKATGVTWAATNAGWATVASDKDIYHPGNHVIFAASTWEWGRMLGLQVRASIPALGMETVSVLTSGQAIGAGALTTPMPNPSSSPSSYVVNLDCTFVFAPWIHCNSATFLIDVVSDTPCPDAYADQVVTGAFTGAVWGSGPYTDDSDLAGAVVHNGLLLPGRQATIHRTPTGTSSSYVGSWANGVQTNDWLSPWCGVDLSVVGPILTADLVTSGVQVPGSTALPDTLQSVGPGPMVWMPNVMYSTTPGGGNIPLTATVKNQGTASVVAPFDNQIQYYNYALGGWYDTGGSATVTQVLGSNDTVVISGAFPDSIFGLSTQDKQMHGYGFSTILRFCADSTQKIIESDEGNNCSSPIDVLVTVPPRASLKLCLASCNSGSSNFNGLTVSLSPGDIRRFVTCYSIASDCTDASGDVSGTSTFTANNTPEDAVTPTGNQGEFTANTVPGIRSENVSVHTSTDGDATVTLRVSPICASCPDLAAPEAQAVCSGTTYTYHDALCNNDITCNGGRYCDFNWREVRP